MIDLLILLGMAVGLCVLMAWLDSPLSNPARYSGRVYDPQRPPVRRAGAVGWTGRICPLCAATTYGISDRCGKCGRLNTAVPLVRTESTRRRSLVERE